MLKYLKMTVATGMAAAGTITEEAAEAALEEAVAETAAVTEMHAAAAKEEVNLLEAEEALQEAAHHHLTVHHAEAIHTVKAEAAQERKGQEEANLNIFR